jgi:hypothetical protein
MFAALRLKEIAAEFNNSLPQPANDKGKTSANKKTSNKDSDTSEYLLENDDQGDSDDDETESVAQPQPTKVFRYMPLLFRYMFFLSIQFTNICSCLLMHMAYLIFFPQSPPGFSRKVLASKKKKKTGPNMPPGRKAGKRVRAEPPRAQLRSSKRLQLSAIDGQTVEEGNGAGAAQGNGAGAAQGNGAGAAQGNGAGAQDITAADEDSVAGDLDMTCANEDNTAGQDDTQGKLNFLCYSNMASLWLICMKLKHLNTNSIL